MADHGTIKRWMKRICLCLVLVLAGTSSYGKDTRVTKQLKVLGTAVIHGKDVTKGKKNAVNDALVAAIGQVVMEMLTGETVVRRFKLINDNIFAKRDNYVQNYRVLAESVSGKTARALVRVDVAQDRVSRDLSRLGLARAGTVYPRILFMVAEKKVADAGFTYWWGERKLMHRTICEAAMAERLQATGFENIAPPDLNAPLNLPMDASEADRMALAGRLGANVLIVGSCTTTATTNTSFEGAVEAQAFNVRTRQLIGRTGQKAMASGQDADKGRREALSNAGNLAGDDLSRQVMAAWQQDQERGAVIEMIVEGTSGHIASFVRLRTTISSLAGVRELKMKAMSANQATMAVSYQGSSRSLADALLKETFSGFGIDIFEVTPKAIRIRLVRQ